MIEQTEYGKFVVCTSPKLFGAISKFNQKFGENDESLKIAAFALTDFLVNASESEPLYKSRLNIYIFSLALFKTQLNLWFDKERSRCPHQTNLITSTQQLIIKLFDSSWPLNNSLLVRELLPENEIFTDFL